MGCILGIESSCDETAAAVVDDRDICACRQQRPHHSGVPVQRSPGQRCPAAAIACVNSAIASAKKAEAVTLECIRDSGMQSKVKCDTVLVEPMHQNVEPHWKWLASFAICGVAILMQQLFIVCDISK
jgi:hypothetical protein